MSQVIEQTGPGTAATTQGVDSENVLLDRLRSGEEAAFAQLVDAWSPVMLRVARSYVANRQSAEDVVQDTWLGLINGLARFEGRSSLRSWTFSILINRAKTRGVREARMVASAGLTACRTGYTSRGPGAVPGAGRRLSRALDIHRVTPAIGRAGRARAGPRDAESYRSGP